MVDKYLRGPNWISTTDWSPAGTPGSSDRVILDSLSPSVVRSANTSIQGLWVQSGYTGVLSGSGATWTIGSAGFVIDCAAANFTNTNALAFATSTTATVSITPSVTFTITVATGRNITLGRALTTSGLVTVSGGTLSLSSYAGTFNGGLTMTSGTLNGNTGSIATTVFTVSGGTFNRNTASSITATRVSWTAGTVALGTGATISLSGSAATLLTLGATITGTATVTLTGSPSSGTRTVAGGTSMATTGMTLLVTGGTDTLSFPGATFAAVNTTGFTGTATGTIFTTGTVTLGNHVATGLDVFPGGIFTPWPGRAVATYNGGTLGADLTCTTFGSSTVTSWSRTSNVGGFTLTYSNGPQYYASRDVNAGTVTLAGGTIRALNGSAPFYVLTGTGTVELLGSAPQNIFAAWATSSNLTGVTVKVGTTGRTIIDTTVGSTGAGRTIKRVENTVVSATIRFADFGIGAGSISEFAIANCTVGGAVPNYDPEFGYFGGEFSDGACTLAYAGAGTVNVTGNTISNMTVTPSATWFAPTSAGNVDAGGNSGWNFSAVATSSGNWLMFFV